MTVSRAHHPSLLIQNPGGSPLFGAEGQSVRCKEGKIVAIAAGLQRLPGEEVIDARRKALVPGLHDHHIHLLATAAARASIDCATLSGPALIMRLRRPGPGQWLRVVNYHESIAGEPDRHQLDRWVNSRPLRMQHSTGQMWFLNSQAVDALELNAARLRHHPGIERDTAGAATGRLFRADQLLSSLMQTNRPAPDLTDISKELASFGVTGVTDTSYKNSDAEFELLRDKQKSGELLQRVRLMGAETLSEQRDRFIQTGELKILLDEAALPDLDALVATVKRVHGKGRGVAVHCVTQIELAVAVHLFTAAGCMRDRIEHASVVAANTLPRLNELGLSVITQPGFIHARGERYLRDFDAASQTELYRLKSLVDQQTPLALSSDAPYGPLNPWLNMQCSVDRKTSSGHVVCGQEGLTPEQALRAYCGAAEQPGRPRTIAPGMPADLAILSAPWPVVRRNLAATGAAATIRAGELIHAG